MIQIRSTIRSVRAPRRRAWLAAPAAALLALLAACGSAPASSSEDDGDPGAASASASPTPSPSESDLGPAAGADPDASAVPSPGAPSGLPADLPACGEVWTAGATLPGRYAGCDDGGTPVVAEVLQCESGQKLVTYGDTFWAVARGPVSQVDSLAADPAYLSAQRSCTG